MSLSGSGSGLRGSATALGLDAHLKRMPEAYGERYTIKQFNRHLQLAGQLTPQSPVAVDVQMLGPQVFDVTVVGLDRPGVLAAITSAVATEGLNVVDLQLATYEEDPQDPTTLFVDVVRVNSREAGVTARDLGERPGARLSSAFAVLAGGDVGSALHAASDSTRTKGLTANRTRVSNRPADPMAGLVVGNDFVLQSLLGTGGMSDVYLAEQRSLNRPVAIKIGRRQGAESFEQEYQSRFAQEASVLAKFQSPEIVSVFAFGVMEGAGGGRPWMALEYLSGGDIAAWVKKNGPPPEATGVRWLKQALTGLQFAHQHGVLHRDLKPHNLLLDENGNVKVTDFGLLKQHTLPSDGKTMAGQILGTPRYMSPEQALGETLDERSDIFSLGTAFFEVFAGKSAFDNPSATALLVKISSEDAPSLLNVRPQSSIPLSVIVRRMMARVRAERYQDVRVVLEDIASYERRGLIGTETPVMGASQLAPAEKTVLSDEFL